MEDTIKVAELAINSGDFNLIVLDSIGALAPKKVIEDELTDSNVALLSRFLTTFLQRNAFNVRRNGVAFLGVNQVRDKIGAYISSYETPGGHAWKHITSLRIQLGRATDIEQEEVKIGINSRFTIKKNKLAPPNRTYTIPIIFGKGIDRMRDVIDFATMLGVMDKGGPYYKFEGETLASGMNKTIEYLNTNKEVLDKIVKACYNSIR
jgi:recombination protein RecA